MKLDNKVLLEPSYGKKNKRTVWPTQYLAACKLYERDQSWVFIGRTDAEAETPILWPPHAKS